MAKKLTRGSDELASYHIGCDLGGPLQSYSLGGQAFPHVTEIVDMGGTRARRTRVYGTVVQLRQEQVDAIMAAAHRDVVRGNKVLSATHHTYRRAPNDRPVGMHVYCVPTSLPHAPLDDSPPPRIIQSVEQWEVPQRNPSPQIAEEQERASVMAEVVERAVTAAVRLLRQPTPAAE